jgi:hypothetical protein
VKRPSPLVVVLDVVPFEVSSTVTKTQIVELALSSAEVIIKNLGIVGPSSFLSGRLVETPPTTAL